MKRLMISVLLLGSVSTFAAESIDQVKTAWTAGIDKRIGILNEIKACVSAATDKAALKACHEKAKAEREMMKNERIEQHIQKLEAKKK